MDGVKVKIAAHPMIPEMTTDENQEGGSGIAGVLRNTRE